jgi:hypothetical protein
MIRFNPLTFITADPSSPWIRLFSRGEFGFCQSCRGAIYRARINVSKKGVINYAPTKDIIRRDWCFRVGAGPRACPDLYGNIMMMGNRRGLPLRYHLVNFHKSGFDNKEILYISVGAGFPCPKGICKPKRTR